MGNCLNILKVWRHLQYVYFRLQQRILCNNSENCDCLKLRRQIIGTAPYAVLCTKGVHIDSHTNVSSCQIFLLLSFSYVFLFVYSDVWFSLL